MYRPCPWHGVWWLVLLLYTSVLHTSMTILNCPIFHAADGSNVPRWYINGNIRCFNDTHIPLGLLAIIVLALCGALIPLFVLVSFDKLTRPRWLHYFAVALTNAYKPKYKWWSGVELGKRLLLVLFSVAFKNNEYPVIFVLIILLGVLGFMKPYKSRAVNILDTVLASDVLILLLLRNTEYIKEALHFVPEQPNSNFNSLPPAQNSTTPVQACLQLSGMSPFAILLTPFYYLPLLIALVVCLSWVGYYSYQWLKDCRKVYKNRQNIESDPETSIASPFELTRMRARTQTVVDIQEYESEDVSIVEQSLPAVLNRKHPPSGVSEDSLTPIASWYLKAKRTSSRRRASRKMKEAAGMELQPVPEKKREKENESLAEENRSKFDEDDSKLEENGGSSTLI